MADHISKNESQDLASRYYSMMAFLSKASLALATGITLPLLGTMGYQPGNIEGAENLPLAYALIPCFIKGIAAAVLFMNYRRLLSS
jgi:Na+/melibiose symporter-like transporter